MGADVDVIRALDDLVAVLEQDIAAYEKVKRRAEEMKRRRLEGSSYRDIVENAQHPLIVETISTAMARLAEAGSRFRRSEARALYAEGMTQEEIARLFGVTRQRISALLRGSDRSGRR